MGQTCDRALRLFRNVDWTTYARRDDKLTLHNFGNGPEPAVRCFGCRRLLPPVLITGDHMVPNSNRDGLRREIAGRLDQLPMQDYIFAVGLQVNPLRGDPIHPSVLSIHQYDAGLDTDLRNIQPLCWYCNSKKGNRAGVKLFPAHAQIPLRPHEAPF